MIFTVFLTLLAFVAGLAVARKNQNNREYVEFADAVIDLIEVPIRWVKKQIPKPSPPTKEQATDERLEKLLKGN